MSEYYAARDVQPVDFVGNMMKGIETAQRQQEANFRLNSLQEQSEWQRDAREAQQLMRAMKLGAGSRSAWDNAMQTLAESGNKQAARYVGQWHPLKAPRLLKAYEKAYGFGGGSAAAASAGSGGRQQAPADAPSMTFEGEQQKRLEQAIAAMPPEQRNQTARNYEHMIRAMHGVNNEADLDAMLQDFVARGMMPQEVADQQRMRYADPDTMWTNFQEDFERVEGLRNALANYTIPSQLGIPVGQQPSYKAEWDDTNQLGVVTETRPGQKPTFSVERPGGIPDGGVGGKWPAGMKDSWDAESTRLARWQNTAEPFLAVKRAADRISLIDPNKSDGVQQVGALYDYVKMLDPTSVVREGEIALLNEAKSLMDTIRGTAEKARNGQVLTPKIITNMKAAAQRLRDIAEQEYRYARQVGIQSIGRYEGYVDEEAAYPDLWRGPSPALPPPPARGTGTQTGIGNVPNPGNDIENAPNRRGGY